MATREELVTLAQALTQLRIRAGVADDEVNTLIGSAIELFEKRRNFKIVDVEVNATITAPGADADIVIDYGNVRGALVGQSLSALRNRLDDNTDASLIGFVLDHPETERSYGTLAVQFQALRALMLTAFDWSALNTVAASARTALADSNYTEGNAFNDSIALQELIAGYANRVPSKTVQSDVFAETTLKPPSGGWPSVVTDSNDLKWYAYVGVPAADIRKSWRLAVLSIIAGLWRARGGGYYDLDQTFDLVDTLTKSDTLPKRNAFR